MSSRLSAVALKGCFFSVIGLVAWDTCVWLGWVGLCWVLLALMFPDWELIDSGGLWSCCGLTGEPEG